MKKSLFVLLGTLAAVGLAAAAYLMVTPPKTLGSEEMKPLPSRVGQLVLDRSLDQVADYIEDGEFDD